MSDSTWVSARQYDLCVPLHLASDCTFDVKTLVSVHCWCGSLILMKCPSWVAWCHPCSFFKRYVASKLIISARDGWHPKMFAAPWFWLIWFLSIILLFVTLLLNSHGSSHYLSVTSHASSFCASGCNCSASHSEQHEGVVNISLKYHWGGSVTTLGPVAYNTVFPITSTISWELGDSRKCYRARGQR